MKSPLSFRRLFTLGFAPALLAAAPLSATIAWDESFTNDTAGTAPSENYAGKGEVWSSSGTGTSRTVQVSATGNPSQSLRIQDSDSGQVIALAQLNRMADFNTSLAGQATLKLGFDLRVDAYSGTGKTDDTLRLSLYSPTTTSRIVLAFGTYAFGSEVRNVLFAATTLSPTPSLTNIVGYDSVAGSLQAGFDFGLYNAATSTANNTGGSFLRVEMAYVDQSTGAVVTVTNGAQAASVTLTGLSAATWSSGDSSSYSIRAYSATAGTGDFYIDNLVLQTIPEPRTTAALFGAGGLLLIAATRLRKR